MTWVRFLPPQFLEVIRLDEEPVLKTGGEYISLVSSSLTASAFNKLYGPVVQRQRLLAYIQKKMVQLHPGLLNTNAQVRQSEERLGLNPSDCGFESRPVQFMIHGSVGNWQTTLA